jgi:hypothetical protein
MSWHILHVQHGSALFSGRFWQLSAFASILAVEVLPVPRIPVNKIAPLKRFFIMALVKIRTKTSCPTKSLNFCGLYLRNNGIYADIIMY